MEKVLTLLEDLQKQVEEEGTAEAEAYEKLACFCKDGEDGKSDDIATNEEEIQTLAGDLLKLEADLATLDASIKALTEKIGEDEAALKEMEEIREKERAIYEAEYADTNKAVEALKQAIIHLEEAQSSSLLANKAEVQSSLDLADAMAIEVIHKEEVTAFLAMDQPAESPPGEYEFRSGGILDTLKDLQTKFEARRDEIQAAEDEKQAAFETAAGAKRDEIDADKATLETDEGTYADTQSSIAEKTEARAEEEAQLNDNKLYLKDLTGQCETKAHEWDQRSEARKGELAAISKALEILSGTVADKAASTGAGGRTTPEGAAGAEAGPPTEEMPPGKLLLHKASAPAKVNATAVSSAAKKPQKMVAGKAFKPGAPMPAAKKAAAAAKKPVLPERRAAPGASGRGSALAARRTLLLAKKPKKAAAGAKPKFQAPMNAPKAARPSAPAARGRGSALAARRTLLQSPAFFQVSAVKTKAAKRMALRNKAVSQLSAAAKTSKSAVLAGLLEEVEKDPFAKVKVLIRQLIERLLSEAKAESTQKGFCDTEMGKAKKDRDFKHEETTKLAAGIMELEAHITKLKETIETLGTELTDLSADLVDATEQRDTEKANNNKTMADGKEGLAALKEAIQVLTDYYKGGLKSKNRYEGGGYEGAALVQESPVTADMGAAGVEGGEKGAYAGNQEAGAGIISMLEVIKSDFERTLETTESNEYQQSRDFADFSRTTKASIATKETGLKQAKEDLERTSGGLIAALNDLQTSQELLDKALEALAALHPTCVDTGMTYEERVAKREAEINALKDALCVLDEEDKEIPECSSFLQSK